LVKQVDHIGVAVNSIEEALRFYRDVLGFEELTREETSDMEAVVVRVGAIKIEIMSPKKEDSPVRKFLAKRGPGIHHIAYETDDLEGDLELVKAAGINAIDQTPRPGLEGTFAAFLHPKSCQGVLTELVSYTRKGI